MLNTPFSPWPSYTDEEAQAAQRVLMSNKVNYWTGSECREFEREFAAWCGTRHAIALSNGTLALDLALKGLGIGRGDEVVVTPRTFIASVSCVVNAGATPVFADVDPESGNLSAETIAKVLSPRTRAVICVHLAGWPCDMDPIMALAAQHGVKQVVLVSSMGVTKPDHPLNRIGNGKVTGRGVACIVNELTGTQRPTADHHLHLNLRSAGACCWRESCASSPPTVWCCALAAPAADAEELLQLVQALQQALTNRTRK